jgi:hypothetical protein
MGDFVCHKCKTKFNSQTKYDEHMLKCRDLLSSFNNYIIKCHVCGSEFVKKSNLQTHLTKYHPGMENANLDIKKTKYLALTNDTNSIANVTNNITNNTVNNTANIGNINNINNIQIQPIIQPMFVKQGEEKVSHITKNHLLAIYSNLDRDKMYTDLIMAFYLDEEAPENHNWGIMYPKNENAAVIYDYDQNELIRASTQVTINNRLGNMINTIIKLNEKMGLYKKENWDKLQKVQKRNLSHMHGLEDHQTIICEEKELYKKVHELAYMNRHIPKKTWGEMGLKGNHLSLKFG